MAQLIVSDSNHADIFHPLIITFEYSPLHILNVTKREFESMEWAKRSYLKKGGISMQATIGQTHKAYWYMKDKPPYPFTGSELARIQDEIDGGDVIE
jgi:hypothetical protein